MKLRRMSLFLYVSGILGISGKRAPRDKIIAIDTTAVLIMKLGSHFEKSIPPFTCVFESFWPVLISQSFLG